MFPASMTTLKVIYNNLYGYFSEILIIVIVYDSDDSLRVKACGSSIPDLVTSSSNSLRLVFKTDNSRNATGFKALWTATNDPPTTRTRLVSCGQHSAVDCSQCPYHGDTWVGEGWCNGDCVWSEAGQNCVLRRNNDGF